MCDSKSFQTKLPVFEQQLAEDVGASISASYVKVLRGGSSPVEALFAKIMIKDKLILVLVDSVKSVDPLSKTLYQQLAEPSQIKKI